MVVVAGSWEADHIAVAHNLFAVVGYIAVEFAVPKEVDHRVVVMEAKEVAGSFSTLTIKILISAC